RQVARARSPCQGVLRAARTVRTRAGGGGHLVVSIDGVPVLDTVVALPTGSPVGFSGATGGLTDVHRVRRRQCRVLALRTAFEVCRRGARGGGTVAGSNGCAGRSHPGPGSG